MKKVYSISEKLFFDLLIICLISYIYFILLPINDFTIMVGTIFALLYFGCNFYMGYRYKLNLLEAMVVGVYGCGMGIFLAFFALYAQLILNNSEFAIWLISPYFAPTLSIINIFSISVNLSYPFILMIINILLVVLGSIASAIMNKFFNIFNVYITQK